MDMTEEQVNAFATIILMSDVRKYINLHKEEYEEFLKKFKQEKGTS